jgi:hypothetical protein
MGLMDRDRNGRDSYGYDRSGRDSYRHEKDIYDSQYDYQYPKWFLYVIVFLVFFALIIEAGFLGIVTYSCYIKDNCYVPYFYGYGRYMAFPIINLGGSTRGDSYMWTTNQSSYECFVNGKKVNCSEMVMFGNDTVFGNLGKAGFAP